MAILNEQVAQSAAQPTPDPAQQPVPGQEQQPVPQEEIQPEEPTPEEQAEFTKIELAGKRVIHEKEETFKQIVEMLKAGKDDPVQTLAQVALVVFGIVDGNSKQGIPESLILRAAEVFLDQIIDLAEKTGIMQVDEQTAADAMNQMIILAGNQYGFDTTGLAAEVKKAKGGQTAQPEPTEEQAEEQVPQQPAAEGVM